MSHLARIPLADGGTLLVEASAVAGGPVKAGRLGDAIHELPGTLQAALAPVTEAASAVLDQLRKAGPDAITVEFGVDLAFEAGAVITKSSATGHLRVTMVWKQTGRPGADSQAD
ncbi:CU044_2847 family protein [Streptomyces sp. NPDC059443]|uniref:CU044_2847 family protein n=1 Tax=unclassified Streptomyces TaxID=2593676 RepID=UPI0036840168